MSGNGFPNEYIEDGYRDRRLKPLADNPDCFVCGKPITRPSEGVSVSSTLYGNLALGAHGACIYGRSTTDISHRYQQACYAAVTGQKEGE